MAALLFKVFTLTIRTAAKPLAGRFQSYVIDHPTLRPAVVSLAQVGVRLCLLPVLWQHHLHKDMLNLRMSLPAEDTQDGGYNYKNVRGQDVQAVCW